MNGSMSVHALRQTLHWIDLAILALFLAPISIWDLKRRRIPDALVFSGIAVFTGKRVVEKTLTLPAALLTVAAGFCAIFLLFILFRGKIGLGDAKLSAMLAIALGLKGWILALLCASFSGICVALPLIATKTINRNERIPFAPFMALGGIVAFLLQPLLPPFL
jgi:leader peptidase (prepilin peptidase)/N-methyltransferase